jgi:preprotein translocase subunit SecF
MEFFRIKKDIPFMRHALVFNVISLLTFALAVFFLATPAACTCRWSSPAARLIEVSYAEAPQLEPIRRRWRAVATPTRRCRTSAARATC